MIRVNSSLVDQKQKTGGRELASSIYLQEWVEPQFWLFTFPCSSILISCCLLLLFKEATAKDESVHITRAMDQVRYRSSRDLFFGSKYDPRNFRVKILWGHQKGLIFQRYGLLSHVIILMHVLASLKQLTGAASATRYTIRPFRGGALAKLQIEQLFDVLNGYDELAQFHTNNQR